MSFDQEFEKFLQNQRKGAEGQRFEMLQRDLIGEKKMFKEVLWPVFKTFEGFILEYELISQSGVKIYIDAYYAPLGLGFESEGFAFHADKITRDRFNFEKMRVRTFIANHIRYIPFSWDELDKRPELCQASLYGILGRFNVEEGNGLSLYEREVMNHAMILGRPFRLSDVLTCLGTGKRIARSTIVKLCDRGYIEALHSERKRQHYYVMNPHHTQTLR